MRQERDKMLATIAEMDSMIGATLQFARDESASEPRRPTDLASLLQSIVDDMSDAGLPVTHAAGRAHRLRMPAGRAQARGPQPARQCRQVRQGRQRAIHTTVASHRDRRSMTKARDCRTGALARVRAFYRLEESRSRETGGVGLGLGDRAVDRAGPRRWWFLPTGRRAAACAGDVAAFRSLGRDLEFVSLELGQIDTLDADQAGLGFTPR